MAGKTVLVLGAGSSIAMGYPIGDELRKLIISAEQRKFLKLIICNENNDERLLIQFVDQFNRSQMNSIDAFLARRPEFSDVGKRTIAAILLNKEDKGLLHSSPHPDNWYRYLFNSITSHIWDDLDFTNISILTFNYDRSLEHYLAFAMMASYGKTFEECCNKLKDLRIIHIYGSLGPCLPTDQNYFPYGDKPTSQTVTIAASALKVIPEGRDNDQLLVNARDMLVTAHKIAFLGFGFDATNLMRLDTTNTCVRSNGLHGDRHRIRRIVATCYGLTDAERTKAANATAYADAPQPQVTTDFLGVGCLDLLRQTLILE